MEEESFGSDHLDGTLTRTGLAEMDSLLEDRPYKCSQCDKSYRHAGSLVNHKKTHQIGLYACLICQKEFSNPMGLKSHLRTHSEEKRFKCEQCGEAFRMSQQLYNHRRSSHSFYSVSNAENNTRRHQANAHSLGLMESSNLMSNLENYIAESMVPADFSQLVSKSYVDGHSQEDYPVKEDVEEQQTCTEEIKEEPVSTDCNTEEYRYKCTQCEKAYKHAGSLANHKQSHVVGLYQCAVCFKEFSNLMAMKTHCRLHSESRARQRCRSPRLSSKTLETSDTLQTDAFNATDLIEKHEEPSYEEDSKEMSSLNFQLHDGLQPDSLCSESVLQHLNTNDMVLGEESSAAQESTFLPEQEVGHLTEQQSFDGTFEEEARSGDSGDRPFKCQECNKTYRHAGSLINHRKTHQTGVYSCSLCSKQMFNVAALNNHFRAHFKSRAGRKLEDSYHNSASFSDLFQNPEDPFQCGICGEHLPSHSDLLQHQALHQEEAIKETFCDPQPPEDPSEVSTFGLLNPPKSEGNIEDSDNSGGLSTPSPVKTEVENFDQPQTMHQWRQDILTSTPLNKTENHGANLQDASSDFIQTAQEPPFLKEESPEVEEQDTSLVDRPYKCDTCGRTYRHKSSLINHRLTHKTGIYRCSLCPKQYANLMALRNHLRFHGRSYAGRRGLLSRRGRSFGHSKTRLLQNKTVNSLEESANMNAHLSLGTDACDLSAEGNLSQVTCSCGETFDCIEKFQSHHQLCEGLNTVSSEEPFTALKEEPLLTKSPEKEESPRKTSEASEHQGGKRVYECNLCDKSYRHSGSLINHKRTHQTGDYMCPYCSRHLHNMAALKNHIRIHHKGKKGQPEDVHDNARFLYSDLCFPHPDDNMFGCVSCGKFFHSEDDLVAHQMVHMALEGEPWKQEVHDSDTEEVATNPPLENIGDCEWKCSNDSDLHDGENYETTNHNSTEDEGEHIDYTCVECGEVYNSVEELNSHKLTHQIGIYQCSFCPKEYSSLLALRNHFQSHTKPQALRNVVKDISDGSEQNESVADHLSSDRQYECGHCGSIFSSEVDFHQHQVAHEKQASEESLPGLHVESKETEFTFSMDSSERELLRRIKSELEEVDHTEAPDGGSQLSHICGFCGETYDDLESLQYHSLSHSTKEPPIENEHIKMEANNEDAGLEEEPLTKDIKTEANVQENSFQLTPNVQENNFQLTPTLTAEDHPDKSPSNEESPESRPYTCDQCGKSYRHGGSLVNHKKTHLVGNFKCVACCRQYPNMAAYRNHLRHNIKCKQQVSVNSQHDLSFSNPEDSLYNTGDEGYSNISPPSIPLLDPSASQILPRDFKPCIDTSSLDHSISDMSFQTQTPRQMISKRKSLSESRNKLLVSLPLLGVNRSDLHKTSQDEKSAHYCKFCGNLFSGFKEFSLHMSNCKEVSDSDQERPSHIKEENMKAEEDQIPSLSVHHEQTETETVIYHRPFRCEVCGRSYRHAGSLINHKQTHKTGVFRCSICQKRFFNLMAMKNHNRIHFELKRHTCLDCGKAFRLQKQLDTHQRIHQQRALVKKSGRRNRRSMRYRRSAQSQQPKASSPYDDHLPEAAPAPIGQMDLVAEISNTSMKMDPDSRPYQCEECGRSYRHAGSLFNHKKSHKMGQYCCNVCYKTYPNLMAMKNHERVHYESKRHHCSQCGKSFKWKRQLSRHQLVHTQENHQFSSQTSLGPLQTKVVGDHWAGRKGGMIRKRSRTSSDSLSTDSEKGPYSSNVLSTTEPVCTVCGVLFSSYDELGNHTCNSIMTSGVKMETGEPLLSKQGEDRPYRCDICGRTYRHAGSLLNHKNTHKKGLYKCSLCNKQFSNPLAIRNHLRTHTAKKRFQCTECGKAFRSSRELVCHLRVHSGSGTYHCPVCNHEFSSKLNLKRHQRTHKNVKPFQSSLLVVPADNEANIIENNFSNSIEEDPTHISPTTQEERRYKCKQCDRSYRHAASLFNHQRTHRTGVYQCPDCLKKFFNMLAFKNHLRIHKYPCKDCGKAFRIASQLEAHLKIHENEGSFSCSLCSQHFPSQPSLEHHQLTHSGSAGDVLEPQPMSSIMVEVT
ncbi:zinc finger protein 646 [Hyperolius riggenbachi]|uniref:zinc finger protein 646 n=1 Tax=Hyperolius riggenbachi TaxID=752182 RepID=UPI0035A35A9A